MFSRYGNVASFKVIRHKATGYSHGYGFIEFCTEEAAAKALQLDGHKMGDKTIHVSYSRPPAPEIQHSNLYIARLPKEYTVTELNKLFSKYGDIINSNILFDKRGISRGIGFVRFAYSHQAEVARQTLHNMTLPGHSLPLVVEQANPKTPKLPPIQVLSETGACGVPVFCVNVMYIHRPLKMCFAYINVYFL